MASCMVGVVALTLSSAVAADLEATTEYECVVTTYEDPSNGAGPLWCYGAPLVVRHGTDVFISTLETGEGVPPLCNTRWRVFRITDQGPELLTEDATYRHREPCPLGVGASGTLYLSVNPSTQPPGTQYGPCDPHIIALEPSATPVGAREVRPPWPEDATFTDHSYRGYAVDGPAEQLLPLNIDAATGEYHWQLLDATQTAVMGGKLGFPIRSCYPQVVLKDRAAYVLAIGDIVEPVEEWRAYKREITGREWDYVFRRLFYSYSPDLTTTPFSEPLEVAELEATAGHIWNLDLWVDDDGTAHLLYLTRSVQSAEMRDRFFPDTPLVSRLVYAQITDGAVTHSREILVAGEEGGTRLPHYGRFHVLPGGRLLVVYSAADVDENGQGYLANWVHDLSDPEMTDDVRLDLSEPFTTFFTAAPRGGSAPSDVLDVYGACPTANTLRYARIRVE